MILQVNFGIFTVSLYKLLKCTPNNYGQIISNVVDF